MALTHIIQKNKEAIRAQSPEMLLEPFAEFQTLRYESYLESAGEPECLREAKAFAFALAHMNIPLEEHDLLAGSQYAAFPPIYYHYRNRWEMRDCIPPDGSITAHRPNTGEKRTRSDYERGLRYWEGEDEYVHKERLLLSPEEKAALDEKWCSGKRVTGHMIADYGYAVRYGLQSLLDKVHVLSMTAMESEKRAWYESVAISLEGVIVHAVRWAECAQESSGKAHTQERKAQLLRMASACRKVPRYGAGSFFEALQSLWLVYCCLMLEQATPYASSFGRFDQYMVPFYERDRKNGILTDDEVMELLQSFYLRTQVGRDVWQVSQNLLVGGKNRDGSDASNALSYLVLRAGKELHSAQPSLAVRIHRNTPVELMDLVSEYIREGSGLPALHNDESVIPSMMRDGFEEQDAYNYGILGCQEPGGSGNECARSTGLKPNLLKCLELALNEGASLVTQKQLGVSTPPLASFRSFDDVWSAYDIQVRRMTDIVTAMERKWDVLQAQYRPVPFLSALILDCIEKGVDYRKTGARYNFSGCLAHGLANTADSLTAIKFLVFEKKLVSLAELKEALHSNFEGTNERIRLMLKEFAPKYGNDDPEADAMVVRVAEHFRNILNQYTNAVGAPYRLWWDTPTLHEVMGHFTAASCDGRKLHDPLSYGTGPAIGAARKGYTAAINSIGRLNHTLYGGTDVSLSFQRSELEGSEGIQRLKTIIGRHFGSNGKHGAHHVHINVLSVDDLKDAIIHPESHADLLVKFHGTSARFIDLDKSTQLEFIARYECGL